MDPESPEAVLTGIMLGLIVLTFIHFLRMFERWRRERRICRLHLELLRLLAERKDVER